MSGDDRAGDASGLAAPPGAGPAGAGPGGLLHAIQSLLYLIAGAIFIVSFIAQPFQIPTGSMEPTLRVGDFLLVDKQVARGGGPWPSTVIRRGDIIVFHYPLNGALHLVKRVVGLPGDRIRLREGRVFRNGELVGEPFAFYNDAPPDGFRDNFPRMRSAEPGIDAHWWMEMRGRVAEGELLVPAGRYFVLGDNRNNSEDSRYWGFVEERAIVGKPFLIYFSVPHGEGARKPIGSEAGRWDRRLLGWVAGLARWERVLRVVR